jgi:hypothetical protein
MARKEWAQGCKAWLNGQLLGDALEVSLKIGEGGSRMNTIGGNTGTTVADPTHMTASIKHAVAKTGTDIRRLRRFRTDKTEVTLKVQIGPEVFTGVGKILTCNPSGAPGKAEFDFDFDGDEQAV